MFYSELQYLYYIYENTHNFFPFSFIISLLLLNFRLISDNLWIT